MNNARIAADYTTRSDYQKHYRKANREKIREIKRRSRERKKKQRVENLAREET